MKHREINSKRNFLTVATCGRTDVIAIHSLVRIEAWSNYSRLFFSNGKTLFVAKVLKKFEQQLPDDLFIRTHNSHLVNLEYIRDFEDHTKKKILLETGENILVARRKRKSVGRQLATLAMSITA